MFENGLMVDYQIDYYVKNFDMLSPYVSSQVRERNGQKIVSYGLTSMGYDARLQPKFKIFKRGGISDKINVIDPLKANDVEYDDFEGDSCLLPPHSYALSPSVEYFKMPEHVGAICLGKSTLARLGLLVNVTPVEPGFSGEIVVEVANLTDSYMRVHANMGIAQFMFFKIAQPHVTYQTVLNGLQRKYQNQKGITTARL